MKLLTPVAAAVVFGTVAIGAPTAAEALPPFRTNDRNAVPACATPERLMAYLRRRNPKLDRRFATIAADYRREGEALGVRWDFAFFQMIVETASLSFRRPDGMPGRVRPEQNNFAALGVRESGAPEIFPDVAGGVAAHMRRLARVSRMRGDWADVSRGWAPDDRTYAQSIESVARRFAENHCDDDDDEDRDAPALAWGREARQPPEAQSARMPAAGRDVPRGPAGTTRATVVDVRPIGPAEPAPPSQPRVQPAAGPEPTPGRDLARRALDRDQARVDRRLAGIGIGEPRDVPARAPAAQLDARSQPDVRPKHHPQPPRVAGAVAALPLPLRPEPPAPGRDPADEAVHALVAGRTVLLDTPVGTQIPIAFAEDGGMQGESRALGWYLGAVRDEGKWWVNKGRLCQRWKVWFDREIQCLTLRQSGAVIHWSSDKGKSGTARIAPRA